MIVTFHSHHWFTISDEQWTLVTTLRTLSRRLVREDALAEEFLGTCFVLLQDFDKV